MGTKILVYFLTVLINGFYSLQSREVFQWIPIQCYQVSSHSFSDRAGYIVHMAQFGGIYRNSGKDILIGGAQ